MDYAGLLETGEYASARPAFNGYSSGQLSSIFCMSTCLETTNGREISGLNAEEQADISLLIKFNNITAEYNFNIEVFTYYDAMIVLRENNVLELIQ